VQKEYFLFPDGYYRRPVEPLTALSDALLNKPAMQLLAASSKTVFVGDSLTDGCKNGGYGWFEPLARAMPHSNYAIEARGGATILTLLNNADQIAAHCADVYVIAAGTNDLRYRAPTICALTSDKFIARIEKLANKILHERPDARLIFVSPWPSLVNDPYNKIPPDKKAALFAEFTKALQQYCRQNGHIFADPAADISAAIEQKPINYYLKDHIHPNARHGIKLYSQKFLESL
jgi:lysophospholipase L1-like esterase